MKIAQIIDSLDVGGAERMAVNYANALLDETGFAALIATRSEGDLKSEIQSGVNYHFLRKKSRIDFGATVRLRNFCKSHQITILHAHGSSFFSALLLKLIYFNIKIIWHDHNGDRDSQSKWDNKVLWFSSIFFGGIIVVNHRIKSWVIRELKCKNVIYLPNFTLFTNLSVTDTKLHGISGKRILHLANLRHPKNHQMVLDAAISIRKSCPDWTFHFVGKDLDDDYSHKLKTFIEANGLHETVYIYGLKTDTANIISQCEIGILSSNYEGLPVSLLEYGIYGKAVVATEVGEIPLIISHGKNGLICPSGNAEKFSEYLSALITNPNLRLTMGKELARTINSNNSKQAVLAQYINWLERNLND